MILRDRLLSSLFITLGLLAFCGGDDITPPLAFDRALRLAPHSQRAHYWSGVMAQYRGDAEVAEKLLEDAAEMHPTDSHAHLRLADLYFHGGRIALGLEHWQAATQGHSLVVRARKASTLCTSHVTACVSQFDSLLSVPGLSHTDKYGLYREALDGLDSIRSPADAERYAREAVELFPEDPYFHRQLANVLSLNQPKAALAEVAVLEKLGYEPGLTFELYGKAYRGLGQWEEAIEAFERSVEHNPGSEWVRYWLGEAYWNVGRRRDAVQEWERAVELSPDFGEAIEALSKSDIGP